MTDTPEIDFLWLAELASTDKSIRFVRVYWKSDDPERRIQGVLICSEDPRTLESTDFQRRNFHGPN